MKVGRKIFAMVDEHTFTMMRTRAMNEGLSLDVAFRHLVKKYINGEISLMPKSEKQHKDREAFNYLKQRKVKK